MSISSSYSKCIQSYELALMVKAFCDARQKLDDDASAVVDAVAVVLRVHVAWTIIVFVSYRTQGNDIQLFTCFY